MLRACVCEPVLGFALVKVKHISYRFEDSAHTDSCYPDAGKKVIVREVVVDDFEEVGKVRKDGFRK